MGRLQCNPECTTTAWAFQLMLGAARDDIWTELHKSSAAFNHTHTEGIEDFPWSSLWI